VKYSNELKAREYGILYSLERRFNFCRVLSVLSFRQSVRPFPYMLTTQGLPTDTHSVNDYRILSEVTELLAAPTLPLHTIMNSYPANVENMVSP